MNGINYGSIDDKFEVFAVLTKSVQGDIVTTTTKNDLSTK
jgi:hypothetical protein